MNKVDCNIMISNNIIKITPTEGILDNSMYKIILDEVKSISGEALVESNVEIYSNLTPLFCTINAVNSLIGQCEIDDKTILYHIREASKLALYINSKIDKINIPFEAEQFTRYKAASESLLRFYIDRASNQMGIEGKVGAVEFNDQLKLADISSLLKALQDEVNKWTDAIRGFGVVEGRVKPVSTQRGKFRIDIPPIKGSPLLYPVDLDYNRTTNYNRGV